MSGALEKAKALRAITLRQVYEQLFERYGPQHWWPGDTSFEVMIGAVLTQNTAWSNVEKAMGTLRRNDCLEAHAIVAVATEQLAQWLRPAGYFNIKAVRLQNLCRWYLERGGLDALQKLQTDELRRAVLSVNGVGPETADDIVLYAFHRPVFVIDAYTRRLFARLGLITGDEGYEHLRAFFENSLSGKDQVSLFNEYHALIVAHAKDVCRKRPLCDQCCLASRCPSRQMKSNAHH